MNVLVTAGNTQTPIDRVRCITNIFTGKTGAQIALEGHRRGHRVTLLTSHPEVIRELAPTLAPGAETWEVRPYRTFDDLRVLMSEAVASGRYETLIHAAAISDYELAGVYVPAAGTKFDPAAGQWHGHAMRDATAGKVKSHHPELWMRLVPTPKLADQVRDPWGFRGTFVKFKLEVGVADAELQRIAAKSRAQSAADWIVANTLEEKEAVAFIGDRNDQFSRIGRGRLAVELWDRLELSTFR